MFPFIAVPLPPGQFYLKKFYQGLLMPSDDGNPPVAFSPLLMLSGAARGSMGNTSHKARRTSLILMIINEEF